MEPQDDKQKKSVIGRANDLADKARQIKGLIDKARMAMKAAQAAAAAIAATPAWPFIIAGVVIIVLVLVILLGGGGGGGTPGLASNDTPPVGGTPGGPPVPAGPLLNYTIKMRDTTVSPIKSTAIPLILAQFPQAKTQYYDTIVTRAIQAGWNPAFVLTLWIEETGASQNTKVAAGGAGVLPASNGHLGCAPWELQTINESLDCLFKNFSGYTNDQFEAFMRIYSGEPAGSTGQPFVNNPNFPGNVLKFYSMLIPSGPGAAVSTGSASGLSITCPIDPTNNTAYITCGTAANPMHGCGHGGMGYPICSSPPYAVCPYSDQLKNAIDVVLSNLGGAQIPVYLPMINRTSVTWSYVSHEYLNSNWGWRQYYSTQFNGEAIRLELTHLNNSDPISRSTSIPSGTQVAITHPIAAHLHTGVTIDGKAVDPITDISMCTAN